MRFLPALAVCLAACAPRELSPLEPVVERFRPSLDLKGDPARGRLLFGKSCLHCHRAGGEGHEAGPDLAAFRSRPSAQLLVDIIDPNREVKPHYVGHKVLTKDGRLLDGLLVTEDAKAVTLKRGYGETDTVPREEIERMTATTFSLMPEGLEQGIDLQQMADLLAYIRVEGDSR